MRGRKAKTTPAAAEVKTETAAETPAAELDKPARAVRKPAVRKAAAPKVTLTVQYMGKEVTEEAMVAAVKAQYTGEIQSLELYVKPEDDAVYYVVNGSETGKVEL